METKDKKLEQLLNNYDLAGVSILHATKEGVDFTFTKGYQELETKKETSINTVYRFASVSKIIVALSVMTLVEKGVLDIYEDISKYLGYKVRNPKHPDKIITLEHLMTQTSSINDGNEDPVLGYDGVNGTSLDISLERLLTDPTYEYYTEKTFLDYAPGEYWCYSNFGCGILACIIEKVTGKYFTDYVKEVILDPLSIDGGFRVEQVNHKDMVASLYNYSKDNVSLCRSLDQFMRYMFPKFELGNNFRGPAGGLFISPMDLSKIMLMMMNKGIYQGIRILKEETIQEMEKVHWQGISDDPSYRAKGLQLNLMSGFSKEVLIGHFGSAYGLRSFMFYNKNNGYILACNGGNYIPVKGDLVKFHRDVIEYLVNKFEG